MVHASAASPCDSTELTMRLPATAALPVEPTVASLSELCTSIRMVKFHFKASLQNIYVLDATKSECRDVSFAIVRGPEDNCVSNVTVSSSSRCVNTNYYLLQVDAGETVSILLGSFQDSCQGKSVTLTVGLQVDNTNQDDNYVPPKIEYEYEGQRDMSPSAAPSASPSASPSTSPSASPSTSPSVSPSTSPSASPSASPSTSPTSEEDYSDDYDDTNDEEDDDHDNDNDYDNDRDNDNDHDHDRNNDNNRRRILNAGRVV
ncbi:hypothetical protein BASA81_015175 [Batrachochytrium salamandrivorans]|nr:hypothetical protein BASA81_015175 [Batrachochytrium salamandrivorans]